MALRFGAIITFVVLAYSFLLFRLYDLQVTKGAYYLARAQSEYTAGLSLAAPRGLIYFTDKDGARFPVALNKDFPLVYATPKTIADPTGAAAELAPLLDIPERDLRAKLANKSSDYALLLKKAGPGVAAQVDDLKLKGIYAETAPDRVYPHDTLAAQMLGYVGPNASNNGESGHYGVEEFYNAMLSGAAASSTAGDPVPGEDLTLTIDPNIQIQAEQVLQGLVQTYRAQGGSVVVEEPQTGKILAMGSFPNFDPNSYGSSPVSDFMNPVTQGIYEPGSVMKVITMAAGIDLHAITPDTVYDDPGKMTLNGKTIKNFDYDTKGPHGRVTMTYVIEHSLNMGAVFAERKIGGPALVDYFRRFGLGDKTDIGLPGEVKGDFRHLTGKYVRDVAYATASYGQGVAVTPLGLLQAVGAIANGGKLMRPYLDARLSPKVVRQVVSPEAARQVGQMMVAAVDTAQAAHIDGYAIAGKTGTAYVPDFKNGGYTQDVIDSYVGFGPASNPRFMILLKLDEPPDAPLAGFSVVPAFRDLAQFILNYYNIPPDRLTANGQ